MKRVNKKDLLEQLKKTPIVQMACEKMGISRATFYRWKQKDQKFSDQIDQAIKEGSYLINDMAESQLIGSIKNNKLPAIIFWLRNHHPKYSAKLEVTTKSADPVLTDEQKEIIRISLNMGFGKYLLEGDNGEPE